VGDRERPDGALTLRERNVKNTLPLAAAKDELSARCAPPDFGAERGVAA
jgi:hypothetical protein